MRYILCCLGIYWLYALIRDLTEDKPPFGEDVEVEDWALGSRM